MTSKDSHDLIIRLSPVWMYLLLAIAGGFTLMTLGHYPGSGYVYIVFSVLLNALLYFGFRQGSLFFDTFLGLFFWIGFWLKFSVRTVFADGKFLDAVGYFDYSADAYDKALLVTSCGVAGLLAARLIREHFLFESLARLNTTSLDSVRVVYNQYRKSTWICFFILVIGLTLSNAYLGVYQRGTVSRTTLPYGLGGIYTWLLLFGASSISAVLIHFELQLRKKISTVLMALVLIETFLSSVAMLSRGMILNSSALILGAYFDAKSCKAAVRFRTVVITLAMLLTLFVGSIFIVGQMRTQFVEQNPDYAIALAEMEAEASFEEFGNVGSQIVTLLMDRWVGMEGVMAVSSYPDLGWGLWEKAWEETYTDRGTSLYDREIAISVYTRIDMSNRHFVSMSGVLPFFYFPGSYVFLFLAMLALSLAGATIEAGVYKWGGGNLILCSLMAFVVAYRYVHFGYVPAQSYLLFGALALNVALIYLLGRILANRSRASEQESGIA